MFLFALTIAANFTSTIKNKKKINMKIAAAVILLAILQTAYAYSQPAGTASESATVTGLDLSMQNLNTIPAEVFSMSELKTLDLSGNNLTEIPGDIKKLKSLAVLDISGNNIGELPFELNRLKFLKEIHLDYDYWHTRLKEVRKVTRAKTILK
jgi:Leucine-rich repeat (LRR) protein